MSYLAEIKQSAVFIQFNNWKSAAEKACAEVDRMRERESKHAEKHLAEHADLRARLAVAEKGLHAIADSCENCTNGGDLRAVAENVLHGLPLGNLKKTGCDDRYCIQTDREKKKLEDRLAVANAELVELTVRMKSYVSDVEGRLKTADAALAAARKALSQIANGYYTDAAGYNLTAIAQAALRPEAKGGAK